MDSSSTIARQREAPWHLVGNIVRERFGQPGLRMHFARTDFNAGKGCGEVKLQKEQTIGPAELENRVVLSLPYIGEIGIGSTLTLNYIAVPGLSKLVDGDYKCNFDCCCGRTIVRRSKKKELKVEIHRDHSGMFLIGTWRIKAKWVGKIGEITVHSHDHGECDAQPAGCKYDSFGGKWE